VADTPDDIPALVQWLNARAAVYDNEAVNDSAAFDFWRGHGNNARDAAAALARLARERDDTRKLADAWFDEYAKMRDALATALRERDEARAVLQRVAAKGCERSTTPFYQCGTDDDRAAWCHACLALEALAQHGA